MSKKNFLPFLVMAAILMALASCSGKLKPLSAQYIQADPQPLEVVGGQVPVTISIAYPDHRMAPCAHPTSVIRI